MNKIRLLAKLAEEAADLALAYSGNESESAMQLVKDIRKLETEIFGK